ncbi:amidase family protein [Methylobacterium sp. J-072]|jgi:aspartyl-tRNA(Asn)/glutamyl-tRNA(Gln) amidotransferase subunit A|uniref:amidase family protein n=1 Tax=Methylobacterium sp. J-072 TaxID=2836651 RepID=UPI001FBADB4A|nr:amidase family protein [Methylobacterium sp. J-072]MCJ2091611.1 amidase family protein [Methylobacterium sp. J-072]
MTAEFDFMTALELRRLVATRAVSPVELTARALSLAESSQATLNAFCHLMGDEARAAARRSEEAVMRGGVLGLLHGLPVSVKDLIAVAGVPYASGSRAMAGNIAAADAPSVERLRAAGAIIIGKTTTSEFGAKPVGDSPLTGITRHPWNLEKTPGGSSAGAAASVAAGITPFAVGTDGGGSLRIPASLTGLVGLKAQFGRVPVWPTSATPTLAHVGSLARNVVDAALLTTAISGHDPRDPFAVAGPVPDLLGAAQASVAGLRVAWSATLGYARPDPEVAAIARTAALALADQGAVVEEIDTVFETDPADLWTAEFYAGIGTRLRGILETRRDLLDPAVADVLDAALAQEMRGYYETVFARYALRDRMVRFFADHDVLLSPTLPISSLEAGRNIPEELGDRSLVSWAFYTYPFNLTGQPAASVCAGLAPDGMPVGLQIVGRTLGEADVVRTAAAIERTQPPGYNIRPNQGW